MRIPPRISMLAAATALLPALLAGPAAASAPVRPDRQDVGHICLTALPAQAHDTLDLIDSGGPYPHPEDGDVFENREGILPRHDPGYYREYTVVTPGSPDRGARRVVTGAPEEDYYTADHYASFDLVDHGC
ncbi:ribonuclease domain-containing protein [Streptomyces sp. NRRL S-118]|uniref:ribonuclease domain-containing protein n=1 Tax=Streptomyces sp. NRRL S-118 TaxID=1463881 RepID=UPI0004C9C0C3|nr:ribonuclease domain-containing protein [Streptomyces sp. NRRL S-118]